MGDYNCEPLTVDRLRQSAKIARENQLNGLPDSSWQIGIQQWAADEIDRLRAELDDLRHCEICERKTGEEVPESLICVRCWNKVSAELANLNRQVLVRTEDMPLLARWWVKDEIGCCGYYGGNFAIGDKIKRIRDPDWDAEDHRPDEKGPITLVIVEPPE